MRCPNCEQLGDVLLNFTPLERSAKYEGELNIIYVHRRALGGCGHAFSPGNLEILAAYLAGELVPRDFLDQAVTRIKELERKLNDLEAGVI